MTLPTNIADNDPGHAGFHNDVNAAVNALAVDSGWRDISSLVATGWAVQSGLHALARRVGNLVELAMFLTHNSGSDLALNLPDGLRPSSYRAWVTTTGRAELTAGGVLYANNGVGTSCALSCIFTTNNAVPESWPGTPAP